VRVSAARSQQQQSGAPSITIKTTHFDASFPRTKAAREERS